MEASTITTTSTFAATASRQRPSSAPLTTICAQNLTRARRSAGARTALAVQWVKGRLDIIGRTEALAAAIFDVDQSAISRALAQSTDTPVTSAELLTFHWERAPEVERDAFVRRHLLAVWDVVDRITR